MSEHQYVAFRAIDAPVSPENLMYMHRQSSRAEITPWSFENEYHFGDFRGDADEMMRRGYDLHLHYANFGVRKLLIRLPHGLPDASGAEPYFAEDALRFMKDKQGPGGILAIEPVHESGSFDEIGDFGDLIDRLLPLRAEILDGDLRPLYLAHLVMACDDEHDPEETREGPVPSGLDQLSDAQSALMEFYEINDGMVAAAAQGIPPLAARSDLRKQYAAWLRGQPEAAKDAWLDGWMADPHSSARREMLNKFHKGKKTSLWPTVRRDRTIAELENAADEVQQEANRKSAKDAARARAKRLAGMAADPDRTLRETEQLVEQRSTAAYGEVAKLLVDLREALAGTDRAGLAEQQAKKLKSKNPKLGRLVSQLRREGFVPK